MTFLSILLPVRDAKETIGRALRSVQIQDGVDFECVVVDDGSVDGTVDRVCEVIAGDSRFRLVEQPRAGLVPALRRAVAESRGDLLGRQDADDESLPQRFERQLAWLKERPRTSLVATGVELRSSRPLTDGGRRYLRWLEQTSSAGQIANALWIESPLPHPTVVIRRSAYEQVGGYRDRGWPEDYDLWLRMRRAGLVLEKIPDPLYRWIDHPERASRKLEAYSRENFLRCRVHHLVRFLGKRSVWIWGAGRDGRRFARALRQEGLPIEGFLDIDAKKIGRVAQDRPIFDAEQWVCDHAISGPPVPSAASPVGFDEGSILLVSVGAAGAREQIQGRLGAAGFIEGTHYLCVA